MSVTVNLCHYFLALLTPRTKVSSGSQLLTIALNTTWPRRWLPSRAWSWWQKRSRE